MLRCTSNGLQNIISNFTSMLYNKYSVIFLYQNRKIYLNLQIICFTQVAYNLVTARLYLSVSVIDDLLLPQTGKCFNSTTWKTHDVGSFAAWVGELGRKRVVKLWEWGKDRNPKSWSEYVQKDRKVKFERRISYSLNCSCTIL